MSDFLKYITKNLCMNSCENSKYSPIGHTFHICTEDREGYYWFYETDQFIIDIHDFYIKKEVMQTNCHDMKKFMSFYSSYIITANGESFNPYQTLSANSLYIVDMNNIDSNYKFLLHGNFPYLSVGINFKHNIIDEYFTDFKDITDVNPSDIFFSTRSIVTNSIEELAKDILNCKMASPAAEIFFEAKAKEWLSITIDAFLKRNTLHISLDDEKALHNVASYLDDHYAVNVSQEILKEIAMMSGTKLKKLFKQKYQLSIKEYSQRRRMNIAEILLLNSNLKIKDIAESVGYSSHSKFTTYYKKYKGIYPREVRKLISK